MRNEIKFFSLCFGLISFSFRFRCKKAKKKLFSHRSENILLPIRFEAKMMGVFRFPFALFRFEAIFWLLFRFVFASSNFRFASDFYVSNRCAISEKSTFFASKQKKFRFRFASFRFEAKMTAHPILRAAES